MSDNPSHCTIHLDHHNSHQFCTFYSVLDEIGTKMITSNVSVLFSLPLLYSLSLSAALTHTHTFTPTHCPHLRSLCLLHTQNKETHQQASISFWEWKINQFLSFFFINNSVSRFGSHRRQLGWCPNSRQSQFLGIFFVFSTLIISLTNSLFSIQYVCLYRYCFFIPVWPKNIYMQHITNTFNSIYSAKQPAWLMIKPDMQCFNASTHTQTFQHIMDRQRLTILTLSNLQTPVNATLPPWGPRQGHAQPPTSGSLTVSLAPHLGSRYLRDFMPFLGNTLLMHINLFINFWLARLLKSGTP